MALRLHLWLGENSPSAESWLHQQASYGLWLASQKGLPDVKPVLSMLSH